MRNAVVRFVFVALAFLLPVNHAGAQFGFGDYPDPTGSPLCSDYVTYWIAAAKEAKDKRCSPGGPAWSTDVKAQADFCFSSSDAEKAARTNELKQAMPFCSVCASSVDFRMSRIVDNILYRCGLSNPDGRWTANREYHLKKCMSLAADLTVAGFTNYYNERLYSVVSEMQRQVDACKQTNPNKNCISCHSSQSVSAVQATPKSGAAFQDAIPRLSRPTKANSKSGNDLAKPSGEDSRRRATPSKSSNTGAMDRLSGDSQFPNSGRPTSTAGEGNRRVPAGGGASGAAKPVISTPGPPTTDFGNCASCGKPPPAPPR
jgi:hypothetical protein